MEVDEHWYAIAPLPSSRPESFPYISKVGHAVREAFYKTCRPKSGYFVDSLNKETKHRWLKWIDH